MTLVQRSDVTVLVLTEAEGVPVFLRDLAHGERYRPVGLVTSVAAAVAVIAERRPDVIVAELATAERLDELGEAAAELREGRIVVVSDLPAEVALVTSLAAGARGFVQKPVEAGVLEQAVAAVALGRTYVDPRCLGWLVELALHGHRSRPHSGLTLRQSQVVQLVRSGLTNRQIAQALGVSTETVKTHLQDAMRKLGAHDRWAATALADGPASP